MKTYTYQLPSSLTFENYTEIEKDIFEKLSKDNYDAVILDASNTKYISSAGLRTILSVKKKYDKLTVVNTTTEVYDIFEMTGFTQILDVERVFPQVSIDGCPIIGKGAHGTVYRLAPDTIVKVYEEGASLADIKNERELSKKAFVLGLPTAIALQVVKVDNRYGTIFELLDAKSCAKYICESQENTDAFIDQSVNLLHRIHSIEVDDQSLPDMKKLTFGYLDKVKDFISEEDYQKLHKLISDIPSQKTLLHGDFHLKNQLMVGDDLMLIDMDTLCLGHSIFEIASICNSYYEFSLIDPKAVTDFLSIPVEKANYIWKQTVKKYYQDLSKEQYHYECNRARVIGCIRAIHFFKKRNYPQEILDKCVSHLKESLAKL